jgi:hypothetical protein
MISLAAPYHSFIPPEFPILPFIKNSVSTNRIFFGLEIQFRFLRTEFFSKGKIEFLGGKKETQGAGREGWKRNFQRKAIMLNNRRAKV